MKRCIARKIIIWISLGIAIVPVPQLASAATITYNLTGDATNPNTYTQIYGTNTHVGQYIFLSPDLYPVTLYAGDTLTGTVTLNAPFTIQAGSSGTRWNLQLQAGQGSGDLTLYYNSDFTFYNNGAEVLAPSQWLDYSSFTDFGTIGFFKSSSTQTPAFTFDKLTFNVSITSITEWDAFTYTEYEVPVGVSFYSNTGTLNSTTINPVPLPAAVWLFGSGLLGLIGLARRKTA